MPHGFVDISSEDAIKLFNHFGVPLKTSETKFVRICKKCGQFDDFACPSKFHSNEVRCYRCNGQDIK